MGVRENEDIFLGEVWGGGKVRLQARNGRAPRPIFVHAARGEVWVKRNP